MECTDYIAISDLVRLLRNAATVTISFVFFLVYFSLIRKGENISFKKRLVEAFSILAFAAANMIIVYL